MSISEWTFWFLGGHSVDKCAIELHHAASSSQTHADETATDSNLVRNLPVRKWTRSGNFVSISEWTFWFLGGHSVDKCAIELHHAASSSHTHADETCRFQKRRASRKLSASLHETIFCKLPRRRRRGWWFLLLSLSNCCVLD